MSDSNDQVFGMSRRAILAAGGVLAAATTLDMRRPALAKDAKDYQFCVSMPFTGLDSYKHQILGFKDAVDKLGGKLTIADANYDVKKQADQIAAFVASKPDALIVLPADPAGVSKAVQAALKADVLTLLCDSYVPGVTVPTVSMGDDFGFGTLSAEYLCKRLNGKGKIATITLPENEAWDMRTLGMEFVLKRYPNIEVVANWGYDTTGKVTPRDAADSMLAAHRDVDAIWTGWDGAAIAAALAIKAAGRDNVFTTGIDGGKQAFEYIQAGSPFCYTVAQSFYQQAYFDVYYAHELLAGRSAPRIVINAAFAVTKDMLKSGIPDNYDQFGVAETLGWHRSL
jgi:ribose transport system substrate-binding protein